MLDNIFTIIISLSLACIEVAFILMLAALCGVYATTLWLAILVYSFLRNTYILHKYAEWF